MDAIFGQEGKAGEPLIPEIKEFEPQQPKDIMNMLAFVMGNRSVDDISLSVRKECTTQECTMPKTTLNCVVNLPTEEEEK